MKNRLLSLGLITLVLAFLSWLAETLFYGDINAEGMLQESFFLPLTFILALIGVVLVTVSIILKRRR